MKAKGGPSLLSMPLLTTCWPSAAMSPTACWQRWIALKEGVKMGDRVVGYAADECKRITVLMEVSRGTI